MSFVVAALRSAAAVGAPRRPSVLAVALAVTAASVARGSDLELIGGTCPSLGCELPAGGHPLVDDAELDDASVRFEELEDAEVWKVSLLQTTLKLGPSAARDGQLVPHIDSTPSSAEVATELAEEPTAFMQTQLEMSSAAARAAPTKIEQQGSWPHDCEGAHSLAPLGLRLQLDTLSVAGALPTGRASAEAAGRAAALSTATRERSAEVAGAAEGRPKMSLMEAALAEPLVLGEGLAGRPSSSTELSILLLYMMFYVLSMFFMFGQLRTVPKIEKKVAEQEKPPRRIFSDTDVEEEEYRRSGVGWLAVTWATSWVARWGSSFSSTMEKIRAHDIPQIGNKEWQAQSCGDRVERLWADELFEKGPIEASVVNVIIRLWTQKVMVMVLFIQAARIFVTQLYIVVLIEKALNYFYWLQGYAAAHGDLPNLVVPMLLSILAFASLPLLNVICMSLGSSLANRLDQQLLGGLAVTLFRKAQRLPAASAGKVGNGAGPPEANKVDAQEHPTQSLDLMTLINYDLAQNLSGCYESVCSCINSLVAFVVLMTMLWMRLKAATLVVLACAIPTVMVTVARGAGLAGCMLDYQDKVDRRVTMLRETLFGIRVVKCYAWEDAMEARIENLRRQEVQSLSKWYHSLGVLYGIVLCFPRMLVFSGLWGYSAIYGHQDVVTIFTCMVILGSLRSMCEIFAASLGRIVNLVPTFKRVETFLRLPEAPLIVPDKIPSWVTLDPMVTPTDANGNKVALSLHGNFRWHPEASTALHDLALDINRGELVAILGEVGSGKSTLLHAILGELFPAAAPIQGSPEWRDPRLIRPTEVAFCPQVAHIAEGTVRDNIVFGGEYDEQRYKQAIHCASLVADLAVIDGGDTALIGARGIALSGGQKARVSMARAAYRTSAKLVLLDDPFGAVDAPTGKFLLEELVTGPMMQDRTRLVVMQPDAERLQLFDRVIVLERGRIKEQGPVNVVMRTEAFSKLLSSQRTTFEADGSNEPSASPADKALHSPTKAEDSNVTVAQALREDESEGRPTWSMLKLYCRLGRWRNLINFSLIFIMQTFIFLICDLVLVHWTNAMAYNPNVADKPYLFGYLFWIAAALCVWFVCWSFGTWFTLRISAHIHGMAFHKILRAPVDRFFDKHPVGRIMNRLHSDIVVIDTSLFLRFFGSFAAVIQTIVPMLYIHTIMPWFLTLAAIPIYFLIASFVSRAWNTLVLMLYCMFTSKSFVAARAGDVASSNVVLRGFRDTHRLAEEFAEAWNDANTVDLTARRVLKRWLVNRVHFLWSFYTTTTFLVGIMNASHIGAGTLGLCLTNLLILDVLLEPNIENSTGALYEFICLARVHEYVSVPQERPMKLMNDARYRSFTTKVPRAALRSLTLGPSGGPNGPEVLLHGERLLAPAADGTALCLAGAAEQPSPSTPKSPSALAPAPSGFAALCPECPYLAEAEQWHTIVAVNDAAGNAEAMARELCRESHSLQEEEEEVLLDVRTGWLSDGALVELKDLRVGYADIPRDVLKGITLTFEKKSKVAIAGTTGCGKSSLLLVLLRILEPRSGSVLLDGVDTRELGLATLRTALGLVPQDPVLFSGTLRENIDPFGAYADGRIMKALTCVRLAETVRSWPDGLNYQVTDEGGNMSFGQRQLVCLARMVLRQPPLLLLDEATSAIDPFTQECVQRALDAEFEHSTLLAVAHRLETVLKFDYAVVLDKGEVAEHGRVNELKERRGGVLRTMLETKSTW